MIIRAGAAAGGAYVLAALGCASGTRTTRDFRDREPLPPPRDPYRPSAPRQRPRLSAEPAAPIVEPGVIARAAWTRQGPAMHLAERMHGINVITVHHDGMSPFQTTNQSEAMERLELIRQAHRGLGWADIGYHYAIDPAGRVYACRPLELQGAHVRDHNHHNLGVVVLGNYERQTPTPEALRALQGFIVSRMHAFGVRPNRVVTHQELRPSACPGRSLQARMVEARHSGGVIATA
ncbi:MAG: N-acetylmuramoyl-L-alanine amidase [Phycisphaerales bacterium]|nr:MAG: N-acetylmuramoyl-L-alanine amidase [Phycisphaerales bacterium]